MWVLLGDSGAGADGVGVGAGVSRVVWVVERRSSAKWYGDHDALVMVVVGWGWRVMMMVLLAMGWSCGGLRGVGGVVAVIVNHSRTSPTTADSHQAVPRPCPAPADPTSPTAIALPSAC